MMTEEMMETTASVPKEDDSGKNMSLTFDSALITGVISSSEAHHAKTVLEYEVVMTVDGETKQTG